VSGPLTGIRVVELAGIGPVPFAATMLADMGADVIRVDRPPAGPRPDSVAANVLDRGRRSISLDLKRPEAAAVALDLVAEADALIEGYRPGVMERLGLGPRECAARNRRLVYGRASGWGQTGPYRLRPGHDINYIAISGALSLIGRAGEPPVPPVALVGDYGGGAMFLLAGVLAGLVEAGRSGQGQVIDAAIVEGAAMLTASIHARRAQGSWLDARGTNKNDTGSHFYNVYRTADDQYVTLGALEPGFYAEMLRLTGLADDPDFAGQWDQQRWPASDPERAARADRTRWPELQRRLAERIRAKTRDEWCEIFSGADTCFAPVLSLDELAEDPQLRARAAVIDVDGVSQPAPAPRFSRTQSAIRRPPADAGQDTDDVLAALGRTPDQIAALRSSGAVY
jgi:alpha-methylacyl-CoA racemase